MGIRPYLECLLGKMLEGIDASVTHGWKIFQIFAIARQILCLGSHMLISDLSDYILVGLV